MAVVPGFMTKRHADLHIFEAIGTQQPEHAVLIGHAEEFCLSILCFLRGAAAFARRGAA
jgi:hypothetical protein